MLPPQFMPPGSAKATVTKKSPAKPKMGVPTKVTRKTVKKPSSKGC
jgi:hypothetical protein